MINKPNLQRFLFTFNISIFGAAIGFSFMVCYYLARVPDYLQTEFLRNQHVATRLDGITAILIYGSTALSGFLIAFIFIYWLYEKPQRAGISKSVWLLSSFGYGIANAFIGGGIFMPLADQILMTIDLSPDLPTTFFVMAEHLFRIPSTMWLSGTQVLYTSLMSCVIFGLGSFAIYKMHEADTNGRYKGNGSLISTLLLSGLIVFLSMSLPVSILRHLG